MDTAAECEATKWKDKACASIMLCTHEHLCAHQSIDHSMDHSIHNSTAHSAVHYLGCFIDYSMDYSVSQCCRGVNISAYNNKCDYIATLFAATVQALTEAGEGMQHIHMHVCIKQAYVCRCIHLRTY